MRAAIRFASLAIAVIVLSGCAAKGPEMKTVDYVDIDRFMGALVCHCQHSDISRKGRTQRR